ncbi:MAG: PilZ domain-containing protein [Candidatus Omnitrophica bacterium]|nr:PilZ domain-containing protein [Candidatus Omnitrophota bacterium]
MDSERRIFDRFPARFPVKFKDSRGEFGQDVFLRDASANGANIVTKDRMFFNDRVDLEVELPDGNAPLVLSGRIVWSKPTNTSMWDAGLQFDDVNFMKIHRIFKYSLTS